MRQLKQTITDRIEKDFLSRCELFGTVKDRIISDISKTEGLTNVFLKFLYSYLPLGDAADYEFDLFLSFASHGAYLYENSDYAKELPDEYFLNYVLAPRINSEDLTDCRPFFYEKLKDRVNGMKTGEAVLEANNWAYENATYRSTSARTASPVTLYKCGYGRCGEESTFLTTILRSLGIAARQVYVPRWSHSDSNHAWVEVYVDGEWKFTGACEPNPVFNAGWFPYAASRAIVVHSIAFSPFTYEKDEVMTKDGAASVFNNASLYAKQKQIHVFVKMPDGKPAEGARVGFEIINSSEFYPVITMYTGETGEFNVKLGLGTVHIYAVCGNLRYESFVEVPEINEVVIVLGEEKADVDWEKYFIHAPESSQMASVSLTPEQENLQNEKNSKGDVIRKERIASYYDVQYAEKYKSYIQITRALKNSYGNIDEIKAFLECDVPGTDINTKERYLCTLTQKDVRDAKASVMLSHLKVYNDEQTVKNRYKYDDAVKEMPVDDEAPSAAKDTNAEFYHAYPDFFSEYVASGRIGIERFTAFRDGIKEILGETCPFKDAKEIRKYVNENIKTYPNEEYDTIITGPVATLTLKAGSETAKNTLFVAICRTYLIPAGLDRSTGAPKYYKDDHFEYADDIMNEKGLLKLHFEDEKLPNYFENFTLEREIADGSFDTIYCGEFFTGLKRDMDLSLAAGTYRIVTCLRTRTGSVAGRKLMFNIDKDKETCVSVTCTENMAESLLVSKDISNTQCFALDNVKELGLNAIMVLKTGAEPTEHVLNELIEMHNMGGKLGCPVTFVINSHEDAEDKTFIRAVEMLKPKVIVDYSKKSADILAKATQTVITSMPFLMIARGRKECVFSDSGYKVGIVDMMMRVTEEASKKESASAEYVNAKKQAVWSDYVKSVKDDYLRLNEYASNCIRFGDVYMKYGMKVVGEAPEGGYPLYIAMHGGGGSDTPDINDQQWAHMGIYYIDSVKCGIYVNVRGVRDTWDCHANPESYPCYDRLIENLIVFANVNPNKVYICGYSAGGDGVYLVAPRMADRFAAAHMSAGHHNGTSVRNLRNCPIQLQVGEYDTAYNRHKVTVEYLQLLDEYAEKDGGYVHSGYVNKDCGHGFKDRTDEEQTVIADPYAWLKDEKARDGIKADTNAIHFLNGYERNPLPDKIVWDLSNRAELRKCTDFYWLCAESEVVSGEIAVSFDSDSNTFKVERNTSGAAFRIMLSTDMIDYSRPVKVINSDGSVIDYEAGYNAEVLARTTMSKGDRYLQFADEIICR